MHWVVLSRERERKHKEVYGLLSMQPIPSAIPRSLRYVTLLLFRTIFITVINLSCRHSTMLSPICTSSAYPCNSQVLPVMDILGCQLHYISNQLKCIGLGIHSLVVFLTEICPISSPLPRLLTSINKN